MKNTEKDYQWFAEPLNTQTNQWLADILPPENFSEDLATTDDRLIKAWRFDEWSQLTYLMSQSGAHINLYNRLGHHGKLRPMNFMRINRGSDIKQKVQEQLDKIVAKKPKLKPAT